MNATALRGATAQDGAAIRALLEANALPTSDLDEAQAEFIVAYDGSRLIGCAGIQRFDKTALVRSVAVREDQRGSGLGRLLMFALERYARGAGVTDLVLLTQTAKPFFERQRYHAIERASVPPAVQQSEEFRSLCPQSAACLSKTL